MGGHEEVLQRGLELDGDLLFKGSDAFCLGEENKMRIELCDVSIGKTNLEVFVIACFRLFFRGADRARGRCQT